MMKCSYRAANLKQIQRSEEYPEPHHKYAINKIQTMRNSINKMPWVAKG